MKGYRMKVQDVLRDMLAHMPVTPDEKARLNAMINATETDANGSVGRGKGGRFTKKDAD